MSKDEFVEVKVYRNGIPPSIANKIVEQGVKGVISGGPIPPKSKEIFDDAGVWHRENVEPSDLEVETPEQEGDD